MSTLVQPAPQKLKQPVLPQGDSCLVVIFGGTGDLTRRKLIPALVRPGLRRLHQPQFSGAGHRPHQARRRGVRLASARRRGHLERRSQLHRRRLEGFRRSGCIICVGDASQPDFYPQLKAKIEEMQKNGASKNVLFYVSTSASLAPPIVEGLGEAGLARNSEGWTRIILEKPFGRDLASAQELNEIVSHVFDETSVYRIDHYLGKETVQNIMMFRFGNSMFEPVWNRNYIDYIEITAAETLGRRGPRRVLRRDRRAARHGRQSHAAAADADRDGAAGQLRRRRGARAEGAGAARHPSHDEREVAKFTVRGQYGPGTIDGKPVPGYRQEPGVNPNSRTETYAAVEFHVDNWRWAGVPFYVRAGKRLAKPLTEIAVHFKRTPQALFSRNPEDVHHNVITMRIQPNEGISLQLQRQAARPAVCAPFASTWTSPTTMPSAQKRPPLTRRYCSTRCAVMPPLFTRRDEVEAEWRIITPIEEAWAELPPPQFPNYAAGSEGPSDADKLIKFDRFRWRPLVHPDGQHS